MTPTSHAKIMRYLSEPQPLEQLRKELSKLEAQAVSMEASKVKLAIKELIPEYQPQLGVM